MSEYLVVLPFPPSVNSYYGVSCNGRMPHKFIKEKGKEYRQQVIDIIDEKNLKLRANLALKATITLTPPDHKIHDIDNVLKALFDALTHAEFWEDDSYVRELHIDYGPVKKPGSVLVHVEAL